MEQNGIAAEVSRTVRECELTEGEASRLVANGRALEQLPAVAAGFADGGVGVACDG